jgi:hypothetical protein
MRRSTCGDRSEVRGAASTPDRRDPASAPRRTPSCVISSAAPAIVIPFKKNDCWMRRMVSSVAVVMATPCTVIVTGTRKTKISQAPSRGERFTRTSVAPASSTTPEITTQNGRNGIAAGMSAT